MALSRDPRDRFTLTAAALVVVAVVLVYAGAMRMPFVLDDLQMVVYNEALHRLWPPTSQFWADPSSGTWGRPVSAFTYAINYAIDPQNTAGYHAVNVALHAINALLLLAIVRRTLLLPRFAAKWNARSATLVAAAFALLWAVHPLLSESVTYITSRTELLFGFFLLLALYARLRAASASSSTRAKLWLSCAVASCLLGVGSKEVMIVAPLVVLLYDGVFLESSPLAAVKVHWRFYLALLCTWGLLAALLGRPELSYRENLEMLSRWDYLKTQAGVIVHYLRLSFWPHPLVIDYFDWPVAKSLGEVLPQGLLIVALLALTIRGLIRRAWYGFVGAWFFLILAPTSSILPIGIEIATERRMYLPLAAVVAGIVIPIAELARRSSTRVRAAALIAAACLAIVLGAVTVHRNQDFRDVSTLARAALDARPNNARMWIAYAGSLKEQGDAESAMGAYELAVRNAPRYPRAYLGRGAMYANLNRFDPAAADFETAMQFDPSMPEPHLELGKLHLVRGELPQAEREFRRAMELYPPWRDPRTWLAGLLIQEKRLDEAEQLLIETQRQHPSPAFEQALQSIRTARANALNPRPAPPPSTATSPVNR